MPTAVPPTIIVNRPGTSNHSVPTAVHSNLDRPLTPKINTTSFPSKDPSQQSCYLCDEQNPGDFSPTTKYLEECLLCARPFCPVHKAVQYEKVCNINHSKYYHECLGKARERLASKSADGTAKRGDAEDILLEKGIYPSLGEREKAIFKTSPVSPEKIKEIEQFRSLDAELSGNQGRRPSTLIEEVDWSKGAEVAI